MAQVFEVQMLITGDKFVTLNTEGIHKEVQEFRRHSTVVDETADITDLAFLHFLLELGDEVGTAGSGVVNQYISITGDFDAVAGVDIVAGEDQVEVCLNDVFGKHQIMIFLARRKFDEAGHFGVGLFHHKVKGLSEVCYIWPCCFHTYFYTFSVISFIYALSGIFFYIFFSFFSFVFFFFLRIDSYCQVKAVIPQEGDNFIFGYRHRLQVGKDFLPEKVFDKLLVERFYMIVLIKDDMIFAQGRQYFLFIDAYTVIQLAGDFFIYFLYQFAG